MLKSWLITDFWNLLKEQQPQGGLTIDSRGLQPAAMNAVTHIFQKSVMNQKTAQNLSPTTPFLPYLKCRAQAQYWPPRNKPAKAAPCQKGES